MLEDTSQRECNHAVTDDGTGSEETPDATKLKAASATPKNKEKRLVLFTMYPFACQWVQNYMEPQGFKVVAIVTARGPRSRRSDRYLEVAKAAPVKIDVIVSDRPAAHHIIVAPYKPDLIFCIGFPWLLRPKLLALPPLGCINMHNSRLPQYKGPNAFGHAVWNGDTKVWLSVHRMTETFDEGNVLVQKSIPLYRSDYVDDVHERYFEIMECIFHEVIEKIENNDPGRKQSNIAAQDGVIDCQAPKFPVEMREVDWTEPALVTHNRTRVFTGDRECPLGALATLEGNRIVIVKSFLPKNKEGKAKEGKDKPLPGTLLKRELPSSETGGETNVTKKIGSEKEGRGAQKPECERLLVQCGDGPLWLVDWRPYSE